jgi:hypothetical protein
MQKKNANMMESKIYLSSLRNVPPFERESIAHWSGSPKINILSAYLEPM